MNGDTAALEPLDRLAVKGLGSLANAQQRTRSRARAERPVCAGRARSFLELSQGGSGLLVGAASRGRLDELSEGEAEAPEILVLARSLGAGEGVLVTAEAVVQHGHHVTGQTDSPSLAAGGRLPGGGFDQLQRLGLVAAPGDEQQRGVPRGRITCGLRDRIGLLDQRRGSGELSSVHMHSRAVGKGKGKEGERAGLASKPDRASCQLMPQLVVPQVACDEPWQPEPTHHVVVIASSVLLKRV